MPGLKPGNLPDRIAVIAAVRSALESIDVRPGRGAVRPNSRGADLAIVIPDAAVRVLLLDFDALPAKLTEALPIVRFRLKKLVPFEVDDAMVSYQVMSSTRSNVRVLAVAIPHDILEEYETAVREAGFEPGVVLPSTLAALAGLTQSEPVLVVNRNGNSVTTAITRGEELLLHRSLELPADETLCNDELRQAVSVSVAYFEDTLSTMPDAVFYAGPGGADQLTCILELEQFRVRDLVPAATIASGNIVPRGLMAGVSGALAS